MAETQKSYLQGTIEFYNRAPSVSAPSDGQGRSGGDGIPHTEVDLILVNGNAEDFAHRPTSGDRITAYPMFEALDIGSTARLRPVPLRDPRFVIDVNLGRLARLLRVLGFDVWWSNDADDQTLADVSLGQQRRPACHCTARTA
jgi:hypothetical protein